MPTKLNIDTQIMKIVSYRYDFCTLLRCNHYKISCLKRLVVFLGSSRSRGGRRSKRRTGIELTARFFARTSEKWMWLDGGLNCSRRDSKAPGATQRRQARLKGARRDSMAPGATQRRQARLKGARRDSMAPGATQWRQARLKGARDET
jgi:hypothetical protein